MLAPGSRVGDYEIEAQLGAGGMATVYRARHVHLGSRWALKVLDPRYRTSTQARARFLDEARIQHTHLDHPNIVKVTGIVATDEHAALVMELVDGGTLEDELARLRGRPDEVRRLMAGVLAGVGHAHAAGIVHRDLKPANVLLARHGDQVVAKVADFGIAKLSAELAAPGKKSTQGDSRMGTLGYMSPEQIKRAKDVTARSDIFSLGAMLYELATGAPPFDGDNDYDVMDAILHGRFVPPEEREPRLDPNLAAVIRQALATDPAHRFASCEAMAAALGSSGARRQRTATPPVPLLPVQAPEPDPEPPEPVTWAMPPQLAHVPAAPPRAHPAWTTDAAAVVTVPRPITRAGRRPGRWWPIALGLGGVAVLVIGIAAWSGKGSAPARSAAPPTVSSLPPRCPADMVAVAGGTFTMGSPPDVGTVAEHPAHRVTLSPFCLDRTEVTVGAFAACGSCQATRAPIEPACNSNQPDRDRHPVNCVSWLDADHYCRVLGKRLPTEAEWELAAGGLDSRTYPWGEALPSSDLVNMRGDDDGYDGTAPVGSFPRGKSPYGALDLAGNVYEWVADENGLYDAGSVVDPAPVVTAAEPAKKAYVMRGGSFRSGDVSDVRVARRAYFKAIVGGIATGFRCASSPL